MNQRTIAPEVNNHICEAVDCFSQATVQMEVKVGQQGRITISLCEKCVSKFVEDN